MKSIWMFGTLVGLLAATMTASASPSPVPDVTVTVGPDSAVCKTQPREVSTEPFTNPSLTLRVNDDCSLTAILDSNFSACHTQPHEVSTPPSLSQEVSVQVDDDCSVDVRAIL